MGQTPPTSTSNVEGRAGPSRRPSFLCTRRCERPARRIFVQVLDKEHPRGVQHTFQMNRDPLNRSVLQQHVDFFDEDGALRRRL